VANVPFCATCNDNFTLDGGLTALTAGTEELVEIQVAVETRHTRFFVRVMRQSLGPGGFGLLVESNTLQGCVTVVTDEAFWVESATSSGDDLARDREGAGLAASCGDTGSSVWSVRMALWF
jgi:hypothetical protein